MTGGIASWIWIAITGACVVVYYLYKRGKIPWLKGRGVKVKLPKILKMFEPKLTVEQLEKLTAGERARALELRKVLAAKRSLASAKAENIRLLREIGGVSEKSVEKEKRDEQKAQEAEVEAKKVKPRRL